MISSAVKSSLLVFGASAASLSPRCPTGLLLDLDLDLDFASFDGLVVVFSFFPFSRCANTSGVITQHSIFFSKAASASPPASESELESLSEESEPPSELLSLSESLSESESLPEWLSEELLFVALFELSESEAR